MKVDEIALKLKEEGNELVKKKEYEAAIIKYDEALVPPQQVDLHARHEHTPLQQGPLLQRTQTLLTGYTSST